jgi:hypothetical protein
MCRSFYSLIVILCFALPVSAVPLEQMAREQAELKSKLEKYDQALTAIQQHLDNKAPAKNSIIIKTLPDNPPVRISDVTFTLSPESSVDPVVTKEAQKEPIFHQETPAVKEKPLPPLTVESFSLSELPWKKIGLFFAGFGLTFVGGLSCLIWIRKRRNRLVQPPLFQDPHSRYMSLTEEAPQLYHQKAEDPVFQGEDECKN